jgi:hypothetical protein
MLKRLQRLRMFELGVSASFTKLRRASKMEFDVQGMCGPIKNVIDPVLVWIRTLLDLHLCDKRNAQAALERGWTDGYGRAAHVFTHETKTWPRSSSTMNT